MIETLAQTRIFSSGAPEGGIELGWLCFAFFAVLVLAAVVVIVSGIRQGSRVEQFRSVADHIDEERRRRDEREASDDERA